MLKRRHNGFEKEINGERPFKSELLPIFFVIGAGMMLLWLRLSTSAELLSCGSYSILLCALVLVRSAVLGGSFAGVIFQPLYAAIFGAAVCLFSASQKFCETGADLKGIAALVLMTPAFFAVSAEGLRFSSELSENSGARRVHLKYRKKYIFLFCVCGGIFAAVLYSVY